MQLITLFPEMIKSLMTRPENRRFYFFKLLLCAAILMLEFQLASAQTTYYVKSGGSDSNNGLTMATAVKTIQRAVDLAGNNGDRIEIKGATYHEKVTVTKSNLTITNYPGTEVYITALDPIDDSAWTLCDTCSSNNIYYTQFIPDDFDETGISHLIENRSYGATMIQFLEVFARKDGENGRLMKIARFPDMPDSIGGIFTPELYGNKVKVYEDRTFRFYGPEQTQAFYESKKGGIFQAMIGTKFTPVQGLIEGGQSDSGFSLGYCLDANVVSGWKKVPVSTHFFPLLSSDRGSENVGLGEGFIVHHSSLMDAASEWYYNKKDRLLFFYAPNETVPTGVKVKSRVSVFNIENADGVVIKNINIKGGAISIINSNSCRLENCEISYLTSFTPIYNSGGEFYNGRPGILVQGNNNIIRNCHISNSWGSGVDIAGNNSTNNLIENNIIENVNWNGDYAPAISLGGQENKIVHNTLRGSGRFLILANGIKRGQVTYNEMSYGMMLGQDGGAFYTCHTPNPSQGDSTEIAYNWIHDMIGSDFITSPGNPSLNRRGTSGIYLDCASSGFFLHHNVVWNAEKGIQVNRIDYTDQPDVLAKKNYVYHNTCMVDQEGDYAIKVNNFDQTYTQNNDSSNVRVYNNLVNNFILEKAELRGNLVDISSTFAATHFIKGDDAGSSREFKLKATSPAIDYQNAINIFISGTTTLLFDIVGSAPDAGAYEQGGEFWTAGHSGTIGVLNSGGARTASEDTMEDDRPSFKEKNSYVIYPNPSTGVVRVSLPIEEEAQLLIITDFQGRETFRSNFSQSKNPDLDLTHLPVGLYVWQLLNDAGKVQSSGRLIKK